MTPPPCNCAHLSQIIVWKRGDKEPTKQRHDRCIHPSGPHPQNEFCAWRTPKTEDDGIKCWDANARLIAAAPDLLRYLKEARRTLEMWKDVAPAVSLCADIDAAIARATGEQP